MLKLRLTRLGDKKRPSYRVVAMEALSKRDGKAVAYLGNYFPLEDSRVVLKEEEIQIIIPIYNGNYTQIKTVLLCNFGEIDYLCISYLK